nr:Thioredoxin [Rachicladosporium sp. CCFEE 5018]
MSARTIIRRAALTSIRIRPTTASASFINTTYTSRIAQPAITQNISSNRFFSATMGKEGVHNLGSKADFDSALSEPGLMVLDCFATWCGPCKVIAPQVVKFSNTYTDTRFYKLDVDEIPDVAQELSVRAMPTFIIFKDGQKVGEVVGANPTALEAAIKQNVAA